MANAGGTILLFFLVNIEIADFYSTGPTLTFNFFSSSLAQDLTYTIGWALFAVAMLVAGLVLHSRAARVAAIFLLLVTVLKCFLHDLARLGGLYRVGSLLGLTISLAARRRPAAEVRDPESGDAGRRSELTRGSAEESRALGQAPRRRHAARRPARQRAHEPDVADQHRVQREQDQQRIVAVEEGDVRVVPA